jgi:general secretion pathway protein H
MTIIRRFASRSSAPSRVRGMTLIEVLVVIAIITVVTGGLFFGSGLFSSSRQRSAATLILAGVRLGMTRANATGRPVRMVFDIDNQRVLLEETTGKMLRVKEEANTGAGAEAATDAERRARAEAERIVEGVQKSRPVFTPVKQFGFDGDEPGAGRELPTGIELFQVQTEHDDQPRREGRAYLYFWPGGGTERASIQIRKQRASDAREGLTVMVSRLTGRAKIERGAVDLPKPRSDDDELSEREER